MASARQKGGKWYYRITVTIGDGTHKYIERGGFKTKKEALEAGIKVELQLKDGDPIPERQKIISFNFLQEEWLSHSDSVYKPRSIKTYREVMRTHIVPYLKDFSITAITTSKCQEVIDAAVDKHLSINRIISIDAAMTQCFKYAIRQGLLKDNPMVGVILPKKRSINGQKLKPPREIRALPKEEINAIFKRFPEGSSVYILLILGYRCGLRIGEALAVCIEDIDFKNKKLHVRRQLQTDEHDRYYFTAIKYGNPGDERVIDLDDDTARILERHIEKIIDLSRHLHYPIYKEGKDHYLTTEDGTERSLIDIRLTDGTFVNKQCINWASSVVHGKHGEFSYVDPDFHYHSLRHTHASECIAAGMSPASVSKRLGHKSITTTYKYYVHETETQVTKSRDIINNMYK